MQIQAIKPYSLGQHQKLHEVYCKPNPNYLQASVMPQQVFAQNVYGINFGAKKTNSFFEQEIAEQPKVISALSKKYLSKTGTVNMNLNITPEEMRNIKRITVIASGSSKNAGEMAAEFIEEVTEIPVTVASASEFMFKDAPMNSKEDLAIFISQSGGTADTLSALTKLKKDGIKTFAVTNNYRSKIAKNADSQVYINAGEEKAVAATKTVTSSIYSLMAMGLKLAEIKGSLHTNGIKHYQEELKKVPHLIEFMIDDLEDVKKAADVISKSDNIYYYAKGSNVGSAKEGALKLTETTGKRVIADSSSEALHGTFASIKPDDPVVQILSSLDDADSGYTVSVDNINEMIKKRNIKHPIIFQEYRDSNIDDKIISKDAIFIDMPISSSLISPILNTVRFQQITNEVTKNLNINPDNGGGFLTKYRNNMSM